jgi:hypothetical protein
VWAKLKENIAADAQRRNDALGTYDLLAAADGEGLVMRLWDEANDARQKALRAIQALMQFFASSKVY